LLIGGSGNDDLEYHAGGQAFLVGGGGSNTLIGGQVEYGNYLPDLAPSLLRGLPLTPSFPIPQDVQNTLSGLEGRPGGGYNYMYGNPTGDNLLVGGPNGNEIVAMGRSDTIYGGNGRDLYDVVPYAPGVVPNTTGGADEPHQVTIHGGSGTNSLSVTPG